MREVVEIGLAFIDLVKAELELLRRALLRLGIAFGLIAAAALIFTCAIGLMLYLVYLKLLGVWGTEWAVFLTSLIAFGCAGTLLWIAAWKQKR